ncbi:RNA polymerase sigma factor [Cryobacterium zongtaii]|uniref:RNA polymerase sigma factor n=1 Tax=Cryobacterium zongtaii TaxID=1259217 RepID=UPI001057228C|nr:RNA polymerase sigma factor [Cryobacterium zongtaii]
MSADLSVSQSVIGRSKGESAKDRAAIQDERAESLLRTDAAAVLQYLARRVDPGDDASDLLSDSMLVVWRKRGAIPANPVEARMWFFGIARRVLLTYRRSASRQNFLVARLKANSATAPVHANKAGNVDDGGEDLRAHVRSLVGTLSDTDREIVTLVHWEGFSLEQAAVMLSMRGSTVRTRYSRARAHLKALLLASEDIAPTAL